MFIEGGCTPCWSCRQKEGQNERGGGGWGVGGNHTLFSSASNSSSVSQPAFRALFSLRISAHYGCCLRESGMRPGQEQDDQGLPLPLSPSLRLPDHDLASSLDGASQRGCGTLFAGSMLPEVSPDAAGLSSLLLSEPIACGCLPQSVLRKSSTAHALEREKTVFTTAQRWLFFRIYHLTP